MSYSFATAAIAFKTARNPEAGKLLQGNTRLMKRGDNYAVRYHNTDIVTYLPSGRIVLISGGWRTSTTKERLSLYSPASISQAKGVWYLHYAGKTYIFQDGMELTATAVYLGTKRCKPSDGTSKAAKAKIKLRQQVGKYASDYIVALLDKKTVPAPGAGDCWYCSMTTEGGETLGECEHNSQGHASHILEHIRERYYVPSLLKRAMEKQGASIVGKTLVGSAWGQCEGFPSLDQPFLRQQLASALRKYILIQLGEAA